MTELIWRIQNDDFLEPTYQWLACSEPSTSLECALTRAHESNAWTCDYVYSHDFNNMNLLTSGYAKGAYPIMELQICTAALRSGTWLNKLVHRDYKKDRHMILDTNLGRTGGPDREAYKYRI